jgi:hypothetical protein
MKKNPIVSLFKYAHKHGWKETFKQWKYNYLMLETPEQLIKKEIIGYIGSIIGMCIAIMMFVFLGYWYLVVAIAFTILIQYSQLVGKLKVLEQFRESQERLKEMGLIGDEKDEPK